MFNAYLPLLIEELANNGGLYGAVTGKQPQFIRNVLTSYCIPWDSSFTGWYIHIVDPGTGDQVPVGTHWQPSIRGIIFTFQHSCILHCSQLHTTASHG